MSESTVSNSGTDFRMHPMQTQHLEAVLQIEQVGFANPWQLQDFEYALNREGSWCVVALDAQDLLGYSVGFKIDREFHLADFAIHPARQRQGVGRELLQRVLAVLKERRFRVVTLEVRASNVRAIQLYTASGFNTVAVRNGYYSKPREDALVMLKALDGKLSDWVGDVVGTMSAY